MVAEIVVCRIVVEVAGTPGVELETLVVDSTGLTALV
jgi:hypothetical protein